LVIAKLPDGSISNEDFYDSMLQRGVIETVLWPKLTDSLKLHMVTDSPEELEAELNRQASAEIARQSEYGLNRDLKKLIRTPEHANEVLEALKGSRLLQGNLKDLLTLGANPRAVFEIIEPKYAAGATKELVEAGIPIAEVFDAVKEQELSIGAVALLYKGGIPIEVIFDDNRLNMVGNYFSALVETGVDAKLLFDRAKDHMSSQFIKHRLGTFLEAGAPANELAEHMNAGDILECLPTLVEYSLDSSIIATALTEQYPGRSQDWYEEMIVKALLRR